MKSKKASTGGSNVVGSATKRKRNISVYSNLATNRRTKKDAAARKRAEYLATLPKQPLQRILYRLHPKRVAKFWFSKDGLKMGLKILGGTALALVLLIGALFAYYRKDLDAFRPGEIDKRVQSTVTKYLDRNGNLLWEDKGTGNYYLVVKSEQITDYMKQATVAIEDKDFYKHSGVSFTGLTRALLSNAQGNAIQGGSTLTQQLVKQVFFAEQAQERGIAGVPRKIKEMILAIEVERMYNKDQILTLYLNESPYGGRRNGVESGAQTYFHKSTKDLTLPEAALLAAIPNNPSLYDPYKSFGHAALLERQHKVLDNMAEMKYITQAQADEAKKFDILATVQADTAGEADKKAPHFVNMVKEQLNAQLGKTVVGNGGLTIKTTLDPDAQAHLEDAMNQMFNGNLAYQECGGNCANYAGFRNGAAAIEDNQTGQVLALVGSKSYDTPGYGQNNAATAYIQPGSSIKPLVYAQLFQKQPDGKPNWGAGSILSDTKTTFGTNYTPNNADGGFKGNIPIRSALDLSRNIPAIKAMQQAGVDPTINTIREMGDTGYCTQGAEAEVGLSSAIGSCGTRLVDHVNAIASLGRLGAYVKQTAVLEVTNSESKSLLKYSMDKPKQVIDPQAAYIVTDIMADRNARAPLLGANSLAHVNGNNIKIAVKTGTSDISINGKAYSKDLWAVGTTPSLSMAVWLGNPDNTRLNVGTGNSRIPMYILDKVMADTTAQYKEQNKIVSDTWARPAGIQTINGDIYPSYFNKANAPSNTKMDFDKVSKKKATSCTPPAAKESIDVLKITDPITKKDSFTAPAGYDATADDNVHNCSDNKPTVNIVSIDKKTGKATISFTQGTFTPQTIDVSVDGGPAQVAQATGSPVTVQLNAAGGTVHTVNVTLTDSGYYQATDQDTYAPKN